MSTENPTTPETPAIPPSAQPHGSVPRPVIVCLCGSTRFMDAFFDAGWAETLKGKIVLSVGVCKHAEHHGGEALGPEVAARLDELHLRKIDLADEVLILNVGGYVGPSTRREAVYAMHHDKAVRWLESYIQPECRKALDELVRQAPNTPAHRPGAKP